MCTDNFDNTKDLGPEMIGHNQSLDELMAATPSEGISGGEVDDGTDPAYGLDNPGDYSASAR